MKPGQRHVAVLSHSVPRGGKIQPSGPNRGFSTSADNRIALVDSYGPARAIPGRHLLTAFSNNKLDSPRSWPTITYKPEIAVNKAALLKRCAGTKGGSNPCDRSMRLLFPYVNQNPDSHLRLIRRSRTCELPSSSRIIQTAETSTCNSRIRLNPSRLGTANPFTFLAFQLQRNKLQQSGTGAAAGVYPSIPPLD